MPDLKRLLQINLYLTVMISGGLLGMAMESTEMVVTAMTGATLGFLITDLLQLFRLQGMIANIASLVILFIAMRDFFPEDGTGKLIAVSNLLVYLQTVLMFQEKTPRLNWQILVLSLLQIVVSAIFSLEFEGGLLLLLYFMVVGAAMFLQFVYAQRTELEQANQTSSRRAKSWFGGAEPASTGPLAFFDGRNLGSLRIGSVGVQLIGWAFVAVIFTSFLFYLAPRHAPAWHGPMSVMVTTAGVSKSVDLDERGIIDPSSQLMFRVKFQSFDGTPLKLSGSPYFRGLALSDLVIRDGKTDWRAPQDRVSNEHYQILPAAPEANDANRVVQLVTLEETDDPLVYGVFPLFRTESTPSEMAFCHEISALTRCRIRESIDLAPYKYQAETLVDPRGRFCRAWPYVSNTNDYVQLPMSADPPQQEWLTRMDPSRYESLCRLSDQLAKENRSEQGTRRDLFRKMEDYFQTPGRFRYTLDFRNIPRDESLDPIEDFVRNHRSGHCELYASALTLMLRRQGIPARLVVGFHGGSFNLMTNSYLVRANNAHAWVEAYLRPEDCDEEMFRSGQASRQGGAWMILESTPIANFANRDSSAEDSYDIARSVWDDLVLGMDNDQQDNGAMTLPVLQWLLHVDVQFWEKQIAQAGSVAGRPWIRYGVPSVIVLALVIFMLSRRPEASEDQRDEPAGLLRRWVAGAVGLISPELKKWVMGNRGSRVAFYDRMLHLLTPYGLTRSKLQTHREFAAQAATRFSGSPHAARIQELLSSVTERYHEVRYGRKNLDAVTEQQLEADLNELQELLATDAPDHQLAPQG